MNPTLALFDLWKSVKGFSSDRAALNALGLSHGAAVHWKAGRQAEVDVVEKMARETGENPLKWIAMVMAEQSTKDPVKRTWERVKASAAILLLTITPIRADAYFSGSETMRASPAQMQSEVYTLCAVTIGYCLKILRALGIRPIFNHFQPI